MMEVEGRRASTRVKTAPLRWWCNEKKNYKRTHKSEGCGMGTEGTEGCVQRCARPLAASIHPKPFLPPTLRPPDRGHDRATHPRDSAAAAQAAEHPQVSAPARLFHVCVQL